MRDGEQSPGASMSLEEKLKISILFDQIGVDIIEAGFMQKIFDFNKKLTKFTNFFPYQLVCSYQSRA